MLPKALTLALIAGFTLTVTNGVVSEPAKPYEPGLSEFMMVVQNHHTKLWLAGNARNWDLADYQVDELKEVLEDVVERIPVYKDMPIAKLVGSTAMPAVGDIEAAIKARDSKAFTSAYDKLTAACNACHEAANRGFIVIQRPTASPFPNQSFAPRRK